MVLKYISDMVNVFFCIPYTFFISFGYAIIMYEVCYPSTNYWTGSLSVQYGSGRYHTKPTCFTDNLLVWYDMPNTMGYELAH